MRDFPLAKVFHLIEPGPVVLLTTAGKSGANVMTMSWHTMMEFVPPLIGCVISPANLSHSTLLKTRECVIAIPTVDLVSKMVDIGNCSGEDVNKFEAFGLTPVRAKKVAAPLIAECLANLECKVADTRMVNRYALFVLEVVKGWTDLKRRERRTLHANGDGTFAVDGRTIDLKKKMVKWEQFL